MVKSHTLDQNTVKQAVYSVVADIGKFTVEELKKIIELNQQNIKKDPLIVPLGQHRYLIGNHAVKKTSTGYALMHRYNDQELCFSSLQNVFIYCVCQHKRQFKLAEKIQQMDKRIDDLTYDELIYTQKIKRVKDQFKKDYFNNRLSQIRLTIDSAKSTLAKVINHAKYSNYRD